jgi:hypothetical protein
MNRWSADTRNRMLLLALVTVGACALIWMGLVERLMSELRLREGRVVAAEKQLAATRAGIEMSHQDAEDLKRADELVATYEGQMAQGDLYRWVVKMMREVQAGRPVVFYEFEPPVVSDLNVPPRVSYKAATYTVTGVGSYKEFGAFLADLENHSPFVRLKSLTLEAAATGIAESDVDDTLSFRMEFVTLVKPSGSVR